MVHAGLQNLADRVQFLASLPILINTTEIQWKLAMYTFKHHTILNESDYEKTWANHGEGIKKRLEQDRDADINDAAGRPAKHIFQHHINAGATTPQETHVRSKYQQWMAKTYASGGISRLEDIQARVHPALEKFHANKHRLAQHGINPDINAHKSLGALEGELDKLPKQEEKTSDADSAKAHAETEHHEDEHWKIKIPKTLHASLHYGQGTKWCTAAKNSHNPFDHYNKQGPLHIMIPKKPKHAGEKYQFHIASGQFMDEKDNQIDTKNHPMKDRPSSFMNKTLEDD